VPHMGASVPVHLQFCGAGAPPHGVAALAPALSAQQAYDVRVRLVMPRSPANLALGNFMVDLAMLAAAPPSSTAPPINAATTTTRGEDCDSLAVKDAPVLAHARRSAILTYRSAPVELARKLLALPWCALGWGRESETLALEMLAAVTFTEPARRSRLRATAAASPPPSSSSSSSSPNTVPMGLPDRVRVRLEIPHIKGGAGAVYGDEKRLDVYELSVEITARLSGLRWFMYRHWIAAFVIFTAAFFGAAMSSSLVVYAGLAFWQYGRQQQAEDEDARQRRIKQPAGGDDDDISGANAEEERGRAIKAEEMSDTERTFPTLAGQAPLKYESRGGMPWAADESARTKEEEAEELGLGRAGDGRPLATEEADDEDEAEDFEAVWRDSGLGTSVEETERSAARRRKRPQRTNS